MTAIYGGNEYDPDAVSGFRFPLPPWNAIPGQDLPRLSINNSGQAVATVTEYSSGTELGSRGILWQQSDSQILGEGSARNISHTGVVVGGSTRWSPPTYSASTLQDSDLYWVNDDGDAAGWSTAGGAFADRAVRWDSSSSSAMELGGGPDVTVSLSRAFAINVAGSTFGFVNYDVTPMQSASLATVWNSSGDVIYLEFGGLAATGTTYSRAFAINDGGMTVGYAPQGAARWTPDGTLTLLNGGGVAVDINEGGTAVGLAYTNGYRAVRWDPGATTGVELEHLGTDPDGMTNAYVWAVNNSDLAVGFAEKYNDGVFAGRAAVYWAPGGEIVDLNTLIAPDSGWTRLLVAQSVSDTGWIAGWGLYDPDGDGPATNYVRLFSMQVTSVPEPGGILALALGWFLVLGRHRTKAAR